MIYTTVRLLYAESSSADDYAPLLASTGLVPFASSHSTGCVIVELAGRCSRRLASSATLIDSRSGTSLLASTTLARPTQVPKLQSTRLPVVIQSCVLAKADLEDKVNSEHTLILHIQSDGLVWLQHRYTLLGNRWPMQLLLSTSKDCNGVPYLAHRAVDYEKLSKYRSSHGISWFDAF